MESRNRPSCIEPNNFFAKKSIVCLLCACLLLVILTPGCSRNAITGRSQLSVRSEAEIEAAAGLQYKQFLAAHPGIDPSSGNQQAIMLQRAGAKLVKAIVVRYSNNQFKSPIAGYTWEFNLVSADEPNLWCFAGGKVIVNTGLFSLLQNEDALAIVLGHVITHDLARHIHPTISQPYAQQLGTIGLQVAQLTEPTESNLAALKIDSAEPDNQGLLPYSRKQEREADHLGIQLAEDAGFDRKEAIVFWRLAKAHFPAKQGHALLNTHPLDKKRLADLESLSKGDQVAMPGDKMVPSAMAMAGY